MLSLLAIIGFVSFSLAQQQCNVPHCTYNATANACTKEMCVINSLPRSAPAESDFANCALDGTSKSLWSTAVFENAKLTFKSSVPIVITKGISSGNFLSNVDLRLKTVGCSADELSSLRAAAKVSNSGSDECARIVTVDTGSYTLGSINQNDADVARCASTAAISAGYKEKLLAAFDAQCPWWNDDINCQTGEVRERPNGVWPDGYTIDEYYTEGNGNGNGNGNANPSPNGNGNPAPAPETAAIDNNNVRPSSASHGRMSAALCGAAASAALMANGHGAWPLPLALGTAGMLFESANAQGSCKVWLEVHVSDLNGVQIVTQQIGSGGEQTITFSTKLKSVTNPAARIC